MSVSTVIIEDAAAYLDSLYRVRDLAVTRLEPGHGSARNDAGAVIDEYIEHRLERERQLVAAVVSGAGTLGDLVDTVYAGIPAELQAAALLQVHVQLVKLADDGFTVFLPNFFGVPGKPYGNAYVLQGMVRACIRREFHVLARRQASPSPKKTATRPSRLPRRKPSRL